MALFSCATNRVYIKDYSEKIRIVKENFPEVYELYRNGNVMIEDVYINKKDFNYHVNYRYIPYRY